MPVKNYLNKLNQLQSKKNPTDSKDYQELAQNCFPEESQQRETFVHFLQEQAYSWRNSSHDPIPYEQTKAAESLFKVYQRLYAFLHLVSLDEEPNLLSADRKEHVRRRALSLAIFFGSFERSFQYLDSFEKANKNSTLPVHNACLFNLPESGCNLSLWQGIVSNQPIPKKTDHFIFSLMSMAKKIEEYHSKNKEVLEKTIFEAEVNLWKERERRRLKKEEGKPVSDALDQFVRDNLAAIQASAQKKFQLSLSPKTDLAILKAYLTKCSYARAAENPEAAALFFKFKMPETAFNSWLSLVLDAQNDDRTIPPICIDGSEIDESYAAYRLEKLSPTSPEAAILGKMTSSCQSIGDFGDNPTRFGITDKDAGFYVIRRKRDKVIVSQALAWRGLDGKMVLDSVETKEEMRNLQPQMFIDLFMVFGHQLVTKYAIPAVQVGAGGETPANLGITTPLPSPAKSNLNYVDSLVQQLIAVHGLPLLDYFIKNNSNKTKLNRSQFSIEKTLSLQALIRYSNLLIAAGLDTEAVKEYLKPFTLLTDVYALNEHLNTCLYYLENIEESAKIVDKIDEDQHIKQKNPLYWFEQNKNYWIDGQVDFSIRIKNQSLIHLAARTNRWDLVELLAEIQPDLLFSSGDFLNTPLHYVCPDPKRLMRILNLLTPEKRLALILKYNKQIENLLSIHLKDIAVFETMISFLSPEFIESELIYFENLAKQTLLHLAAGNAEALNALLKLYPNSETKLFMLRKKNVDSETALHRAAASPQALELLLMQYNNSEDLFEAILEKDRRGRTVLHRAAEHSLESLKIILKYYPHKDAIIADLMKPDNEGITPLHWVASKSSASFKKFLDYFPNDQAVQDAFFTGKYTLIHYAALNKELNSLHVILDFFPDNESRLMALRRVGDIWAFAACNPGAIHTLLSIFPDNSSRVAVLRQSADDSLSNIQAITVHQKEENLLKLLDVVLSLLSDDASKFALFYPVRAGYPIFCWRVSPAPLQLILDSLSDNQLKLSLVRDTSYIEHIMCDHLLATFKVCLSVYPDDLTKLTLFNKNNFGSLGKNKKILLAIVETFSKESLVPAAQNLFWTQAEALIGILQKLPPKGKNKLFDANPFCIALRKMAPNLRALLLIEKLEDPETKNSLESLKAILSSHFQVKNQVISWYFEQEHLFQPSEKSPAFFKACKTPVQNMFKELCKELNIQEKDLRSPSPPGCIIT